MLVELADRLARALGVAHLDERKSTRLAGGAIADDVDAGDLAGRLEQRLQIGFGVSYGRLPTYNLVLMNDSCISKMQLL
jgi:hypothetical protein